MAHIVVDFDERRMRMLAVVEEPFHLRAHSPEKDWLLRSYTVNNVRVQDGDVIADRCHDCRGRYGEDFLWGPFSGLPVCLIDHVFVHYEFLLLIFRRFPDRM